MAQSDNINFKVQGFQKGKVDGDNWKQQEHPLQLLAQEQQWRGSETEITSEVCNSLKGKFREVGYKLRVPKEIVKRFWIWGCPQ